MVLLAHSFYLRRDSKQFERHKPYAPLTTLILAAMLREEGREVILFDSTFAEGSGQFCDILEGQPPSVFLLVEDNFNFLTKMCTEKRREDALQMIRAACQNGWIVGVNSPDAVDNPGQYLAAGASAVLTGEGEFTAGEFVDAVNSCSDLTAVAGLILPGDGDSLKHTLPRITRPELNRLPLPAWDLVDADAYRDAWTRHHGYFSWNAASSRGCPYSCNWCAKPTFGRRYSQRSPQSMAEEMQRLKAEIGPDHVWFADDIFGMTADWIANFAKEVIARDAVIPFMAQSRVNLITPATAAALRSAGAHEIWLGVESGSQRVLEAMDKGSHVDTARVATRNLRREGIRACWFLQLGYPPEDIEDIWLTRDMVREEKPDEIGVSVAYPLPGTPFHSRLAGKLGARRNWRDTDELAMLFPGTFDTEFYRMVRDELHLEVALRRQDAGAWDELAARAPHHRQVAPVARLRA